jgi:hypothetical protein
VGCPRINCGRDCCLGRHGPRALGTRNEAALGQIRDSLRPRSPSRKESRNQDQTGLRRAPRKRGPDQCIRFLANFALTDNFGEYLHGPQLDYVIGHELAHAKNKPTRKQLTILVSIFLSLIVFSFTLAPFVPGYQPLLMLIALSAPLFGYYAISRRFEYQADRDAVLLTGTLLRQECAL